MAKFIVAAIFLLLVAKPAHAYLDPGTGSMLIQGLLAGVAAASVGIASYWSRIKGFFSRDKASGTTEEIDSDDESTK